MYNTDSIPGDITGLSRATVNATVTGGISATSGGTITNARVSSPSGDSSLEELHQALTGLVGVAGVEISSKPVLHDHFRDDGLGRVSAAAKDISDKFKDVNSQISASWSDVGAFADKIETRIINLMNQFGRELGTFIETSKGYEGDISTATQSANDAASDILSKLGLE